MSDKIININISIPLQDDDRESYYLKRTHSVDLTFGIKPVAFEVANILNDKIMNDDSLIETIREVSEKEYDSFITRLETFPFFNGREQGLGIAIKEEYGYSSECPVICWSENRNSDDIVVYIGKSNHSLNPPTLNDISNDEFWNTKTYFDYDDAEGAAEFINQKIKEISLDYAEKESIEKGLKEGQPQKSQSLKI